MDRELETWSGQTKGYTIGICYSAKPACLKSKNKDWLPRNHMQRLFLLSIVSNWLFFKSNFSAILWRKQVAFRYDDKVRSVLDQHA
jgi:hypothetical protein